MLGTPAPEAVVQEDPDGARLQDEVRGTALGDLPVEPQPSTGGVDRLAGKHL